MLTACGVTPLTNKVDLSAPFVIGVGQGPDSSTDLYAAAASGGSFVRLSFNRAEERGPRLAPDGRRVAFFRRATDEAAWSLVILDLMSMAEQRAPLPAGAGEPERLGWTPSGVVLVRAGSYFETASGDARLAPSQRPQAEADSALSELLGQPVRAMAVTCANSRPCIRAADGTVTDLGPAVRGVIRWGADSVGYFQGASFEVRPLGGGRIRRPGWTALPGGLRELSYSPGATSPP